MSISQRTTRALWRASLWLMAFVPFLNPVHTWPIPSFYSEWLAAALGLAVLASTLAMARSAENWPLPKIVLLPLGLTAAVLMQLAMGHVSHPRHALLYCCCLLLSGALMMAGHFAARQRGLAEIADILATAFMAGSLLQGGLLVLQQADPGMPWAGFAPLSGAAPGGALGQRNHLVDYLWLGIASVAYLIARQRIAGWIGAVIVLAIAVTSVLPASRSAFLYPVGLSIVATLAWHRSGQLAAWRNITLVCLLTIPVMLVSDHPTTNSSLLNSRSSPTATERLAARELDPVRSGLLQVAWLATLDQPLFGHGVGAAPRVTFEHAATWPAHTRPVVAEHFHNLIAQWLVEFGMPLALAAIVMVLRWLCDVLRMARAPEHWWALALLSIVGLHSQLEYPLWLVYFLAPVSLLMGALAAPLAEPAIRGRHALAAGVGIGLACLGLAALWNDYRQIERFNAAAAAVLTPNELTRNIEAALALEKHSLLAPNALLLVASSMGVSRLGADAKWALCEQALKISPKRNIVFKCAAIAALVGKPSAATGLVRLGSAAYADELPALAAEWAALAADFPELRAYPWFCMADESRK